MHENIMIEISTQSIDVTSKERKIQEATSKLANISQAA
jgi:hypothetical protein